MRPSPLPRRLAAAITALVSPWLALLGVAAALPHHSLGSFWTSISLNEMLFEVPTLLFSAAGLALMWIRPDGSGLVPLRRQARGAVSAGGPAWRVQRDALVALYAALLGLLVGLLAWVVLATWLQPAVQGTRFEGLAAPASIALSLLPSLAVAVMGLRLPAWCARARLTGRIDGWWASDSLEVTARITLAALASAALGVLAVAVENFTGPSTTLLIFNWWAMLTALLAPLLYAALRWRRAATSPAAVHWVVSPDLPAAALRHPQLPLKLKVPAGLRQPGSLDDLLGSHPGPTVLLTPPETGAGGEHLAVALALGRQAVLFPSHAGQLADWDAQLPPPGRWASLPVREWHPPRALLRQALQLQADAQDRLTLVTASAAEVLAWQDLARPRVCKLEWRGAGAPPPSAFDQPQPAADGSGAPSESIYSAFICYSHADERHAKWLHSWLESFHVPANLVGRRSKQDFDVPATLKPVYRDVEEISAGQRADEHLREALARSQNLIVICSPNAAKSQWVNEEIRHFQSFGKSDRILCLIVDGDPSAKSGPTQCMPAALLGSADSGVDFLAADMRPGKDKPQFAALRVAAAALGVTFDELRSRERRVRRLSVLIAAAFTLLVVMGVLAFYALQQRDEAARQREEALTQTRAAEDQRRIAEGRQKELEDAAASARELAKRVAELERRAEERKKLDSQTRQNSTTKPPATGAKEGAANSANR